MMPATFFQLSQNTQFQKLLSDAIFVREKIKSPYKLRLYLLGSYYYELTLDKKSGQCLYISFLDEADVPVIYPGVSEFKNYNRLNEF